MFLETKRESKSCHTVTMATTFQLYYIVNDISI